MCVPGGTATRALSHAAALAITACHMVARLARMAGHVAHLATRLTHVVAHVPRIIARGLGGCHRSNPEQKNNPEKDYDDLFVSEMNHVIHIFSESLIVNSCQDRTCYLFHKPLVFQPSSHGEFGLVLNYGFCQETLRKVSVALPRITFWELFPVQRMLRQRKTYTRLDDYVGNIGRNKILFRGR